MSKLKAVLIERYIGAIVVAMLIVDGLQNLLGIIVYPLQYVLLRKSKQSPFNLPEQPLDPAVLMLGICRAAIPLIVAYILISWLYLRREVPSGPTEETDQLAD